jgi:hypothetical protein
VTSSPPLIATSIAPNDRIAVQQQAVGSWLASGFEVVSYNALEEIERLRPSFPQLSFEPMLRNAKLMTGKPVVFISDILHALRKSGRPVCGLVNSDVFFAHGGPLLAAIAAGAATGLVYGPRFEVPSFTQGDGGMLDPYGSDFFFFGRTVIDAFGESRLCLGMPYWDHWLPLSALLRSVPTIKLISPAVRHIPHPTQRDDSFFLFADEFIQLVTERMDAPGAPPVGREPFRLDGAQRRYAALKHSALEAETLNLPNEQRHMRYEELALFCDEVSRYVVGYLDRNSRRVS